MNSKKNSSEQSQMKNLQLASNRQQQGVVIVIALLVVALVAAMAYIMMARLSRDTTRQELILRDARAMRYADGMLAWAKDQLRNNWEKKQDNKLVDVMPVMAPATEQEGFRIEAKIVDVQGRFNLNEVLHPDQMVKFERLLMVLNPGLAKEQASEIVVTLSEWLTPGRRDGGMNEYYLKLPLPYRAAHRAMLHPSELRMVKGVSQAVYQSVRPYVTTLPPGAELNIQTASAPVIMSLDQRIDLNLAKEIVRQRQAKPFIKPEDFQALPAVKSRGLKLDGLKLTTTSQYFLLVTEISIEMQRWVIYTLLKREINDKKAKVHLIWQSRSGD